MDNRVYNILRNNNIPYTKINDEVIRIDTDKQLDTRIFIHGLRGVCLLICDEMDMYVDNTDLSKGSYMIANCLYLLGTVTSEEYNSYTEEKPYVACIMCNGPLQDFMGTMYEKGESNYARDYR